MHDLRSLSGDKSGFAAVRVLQDKIQEGGGLPFSLPFLFEVVTIREFASMKRPRILQMGSFPSLDGARSADACSRGRKQSRLMLFAHA